MILPVEVEQVLAQSDVEHRALTQDRLAAIRRAETENPSKERFDLSRLGELYDLIGDDGVLHPDPERDLALEHRYWVTHPEVATIEEFARLLQSIKASGET